jgi:uncharacterized membrane protein
MCEICVKWTFSLLKDTHLTLVLMLSIFAWAPLLTPAYFFEAHDAKHSIFFLVEFNQTFCDGYWWPRWSPDFAFGYGYPLFNLYAPLAFYAAQLLHLLGLGLTPAIKTMYALATIGGGVGMYAFARRLYGSPGGLLAAVVYMYVPFHLVEIYVRSAYAEFVSLALIPFLFLAFTELIARPSLRRLALAGLVYGLLALTHHTSFFTFSPFLMVYLLYLIFAKSRLNLRALVTHGLYAAAAGLLGLALAAIYLLPVVAETRYIKVEQWTSGSYSYLQHFVYFSQLFEENWGYGYAGPGALDDFSYQLGLVVVVLLIYSWVTSLTTRYANRAMTFFFLISTLIIILLMSPLAQTVWQIIPIASLVQFPWRLLAVTAFTMSVAAGALLANEQLAMDNEQFTIHNSSTPPTLQPAPLPAFQPSSLPTLRPSTFLLLLIVILASFNYTTPQYTDIPAWAESPVAVIHWDRASIVDRVGMVAVTAEQPQTSPMEQQYLNNEPLVTAGLIAGQGRIEMLHHGGASDTVRVLAETAVTLQFYTYDYPGWQVTLNNQPIKHRPAPPFGLITIDIPPGEHIAHLEMGSTPPRTMGAIMSALAGILILILSLFNPKALAPVVAVPPTFPA